MAARRWVACAHRVLPALPAWGRGILFGCKRTGWSHPQGAPRPWLGPRGNPHHKQVEGRPHAAGVPQVGTPVTQEDGKTRESKLSYGQRPRAAEVGEGLA